MDDQARDPAEVEREIQRNADWADYLRRIDDELRVAEEHLSVPPGAISGIQNEPEYLFIVKVFAALEPIINEPVCPASIGFRPRRRPPLFCQHAPGRAGAGRAAIRRPTLDSRCSLSPGRARRRLRPAAPGDLKNSPIVRAPDLRPPDPSQTTQQGGPCRAGA